MNKLLIAMVIGSLGISLVSLVLIIQTRHTLDTVSTVASSTAQISDKEGYVLTKIEDFIQVSFPTQVTNYINSHAAPPVGK